jgi:hypothetical protein
MSETPKDPAGTTHQFQNFAAQAPAAESSGKVNVGLIVGVVVVVALVAVAAVAGALLFL